MRGIRAVGALVAVAALLLGGAGADAAATHTSVDCGAGADLQAAINAAPKSAILEVVLAGSLAVGMICVGGMPMPTTA